MHSFILQDYTTIRGSTSTNVTQSESGWLDLTPYQDLVFWLDVREVTGTVTITYQTSPTKDESLFTSIVTGQQLAVGVAAPKTALMSGAVAPVARFVRWTLTAPAVAWGCTFRVYVAANSPGM